MSLFDLLKRKEMYEEDLRCSAKAVINLYEKLNKDSIKIMKRKNREGIETDIRVQDHKKYIKDLTDLFGVSLDKKCTRDTISNIIEHITLAVRDHPNIGEFLRLVSNPFDSICKIDAEFNEKAESYGKLLKDGDPETGDEVTGLVIRLTASDKSREHAVTQYQKTYSEIVDWALMDIFLETIESLSLCIERIKNPDYLREKEREIFRDLLRNHKMNHVEDYEVIDRVSQKRYEKEFSKHWYPQALKPWFSYVFHRLDTREESVQGTSPQTIYNDAMFPNLAAYNNKAKNISRAVLLLKDFKKYISLLTEADKTVHRPLSLYVLNQNTALVSAFLLSTYSDETQMKPFLKRLSNNKLRLIPRREYRIQKANFRNVDRKDDVIVRLPAAKLIYPGIMARFLCSENSEDFVYDKEAFLAIIYTKKILFGLLKSFLLEVERGDATRMYRLGMVYLYLLKRDPDNQSNCLQVLVNKIQNNDFNRRKFMHAYHLLWRNFKKAKALQAKNKWVPSV